MGHFFVLNFLRDSFSYYDWNMDPTRGLVSFVGCHLEETAQFLRFSFEKSGPRLLDPWSLKGNKIENGIYYFYSVLRT